MVTPFSQIGPKSNNFDEFYQFLQKNFWIAAQVINNPIFTENQQRKAKSV